MAVGRLVGWLVGVVVCAPLVLCAGNQGVSRLYKRHGPAKYRPVSRGSHYLRFNYFPLEVCRIASRVFPPRRRYLSSSRDVFLFFILRSPFPSLPPSHHFSLRTSSFACSHFLSICNQRFLVDLRSTTSFLRRVALDERLWNLTVTGVRKIGRGIILAVA